MSLSKYIKTIINTFKSPIKIPVTVTLPYDNLLKGKTAVIFGGTGGIGIAIAKDFIKNGAKVIIVGSSNKKRDSIVHQFSDNVEFEAEDLSDFYNYPHLFDNLSNKYGQINIMVNSAGIHTPNVNFWSMTPEEFSRIIELNLKSNFFLVQEFGKYAKENGGKVLIISSSRGSEPAWSPYGVSKWGLKGMTLGLAQMLAQKNIILNTIAPGTTATPLIGYEGGKSIYTNENCIHRMILPEEVGSLASFLVSDLNKSIIGETIHISAGRGLFDIR